MFLYLRIIIYAAILFFTSCHNINNNSASIDIAEDKITYLSPKSDLDNKNFINSKNVILDFF